jgi:hypothetical protein
MARISTTTAPVPTNGRSPLPHPIEAAHMAMCAKLYAIQPPRIYADPGPAEFENAADYIAAVARVMDEWHRMVGHEVQANATARVSQECFADAFRGATEGFSIFECTRAAEALREENADFAADPRGHARAERLGID